MVAQLPSESPSPPIALDRLGGEAWARQKTLAGMSWLPTGSDHHAAVTASRFRQERDGDA